MKKFLCCFKGESSRQAEQQPSQPQQQQAQQNPLQPFGDNEYLNYLSRHDLNDDRVRRGRSSTHPLVDCGLTFRWEEILEGTGNLRRTNFLGQGNFGEVYRCDFPRNNTVGAAKIQRLENPYAHPEFIAEITTLHIANHPNVIRLLGKCFGQQSCVIVYEFMPNGSLDHHLYAQVRPGPGLPQESPGLDWVTRMRIAVGVAEALVYLHDGLKVIHRDVKVSNVLLDADFVPKLTDFGLATKIDVDEDGVERQSVINPIKGTPGYIAPETEQFGLVSTKSDIYSYGVFLLELFTGRKAYDRERPLATRKITDWLIPVWSSRVETMHLVIDVTLGDRFSVEGLVRLFQAARMCIDPQVTARPDMDFVEHMVRQAAAYPVTVWPPLTHRASF